MIALNSAPSISYTENIFDCQFEFNYLMASGIFS